MVLVLSDDAPLRSAWWSKHSDAVVVGVLTAVAIGGGTLLWNLNGQVSAISARLEASDGRIDRIASTLPDLGIRVASEDLFRQYDYAAIQISRDGQPDRLVILDLRKRTQVLWQSPAGVQNGKLLEAAVTGAVIETTNSAYSFADLSSAANKMGRMLPAPDALLAGGSWVAVGTPDALEVRLRDLGWTRASSSVLSEGPRHYEAILDRVRDAVVAQ